LTAGKIVGLGVDFVFELDDFEGLDGAAFAFTEADASDFERQDNVVEDGVVTVHEKLLENEAEFVVAQAIESAGGQLGGFGAVEFDSAGGGLVEQSEEVHKGRFTAAGFANNGDRFAGIDFKIDVAEGIELGTLFSIGFMEIVGFQ